MPKRIIDILEIDVNGMLHYTSQEECDKDNFMFMQIESKDFKLPQAEIELMIQDAERYK